MSIKITIYSNKGTPCTNIYIISNGECEVSIVNNNKATFLDVLYTGCSVGCYTSLTSDDYTLNGKAKTDLTVLKLPFEKLNSLREKYEKLDDKMTEYETYIQDNGLPYCDYKLHRNKMLVMTPYEKFQTGIRRIIRIIKSSKSSMFTDLLDTVQVNVKEKQSEREKRRKKMMLKGVSTDQDQRNQEAILMLTEKVEDLFLLVNYILKILNFFS